MIRVTLITLALVALTTSSYLQMPLVRTPPQSSYEHFTPIKCHPPVNNSDAEYTEICYEKDITYSIPFIKDGLHYSLSADFTTPISWIKAKGCKVESTHEKCHRVTETIAEQVKQKTKSKSKLHKLAEDQTQEQNTIIQGSSQTIRGEFQKEKTVSLIVKDSSRLNNFFELIMLGLFIYGEKDNITLINTNFVNAMYISSNLDGLTDGAISLRFDQTAEHSFLDQIFAYVKAFQKTVVVSLGTSGNNITIGDLTAKSTREGYSGIKWIDMPSNQGYGKMVQITKVGFGDISQDKEDEKSQTIPSVFTLSASYLSFPEQTIEKDLIPILSKEAVCKLNTDNFLECSTTAKKKMTKLLQLKLILGFKDDNMILDLNKLVLKVEHNKRAIFNIKKSYNHWAILGEPIFQKYIMFFDYFKDRVGFSAKRQENDDDLMVEVVTLVRFLCCTMVLGCLFICCFEPCRKLAKKIDKFKREIKKKQIQEQRDRRRRRQPEEVPIEDKGQASLAETNQIKPESPGSLIDDI